MLGFALIGLLLAAPPRPPLVQQFIAVDAPLIALRRVRVVDGTGAPGRDDQTLVIADGRLREVGGPETPVPQGALVLELPGRTVIPGLVGMHQHLFYPSRPLPPAEARSLVYHAMGFSFPRL